MTKSRKRHRDLLLDNNNNFRADNIHTIRYVGSARNDGEIDRMQRADEYVDNASTTPDLSTACSISGFMRCKLDPCDHHLQIIWPPDALTRLVMAADGVSEEALDALLRRIVQTRKARPVDESNTPLPKQKGPDR